MKGQVGNQQRWVEQVAVAKTPLRMVGQCLEYREGAWSITAIVLVKTWL